MENSTETNWTTYRYVQYVFYFIQIAFYALCLMGNFLTMIAVAKFENLHKKPTNILIFSLAIADGFQGLLFCILDPTCNKFSFKDHKVTTNKFLCIKITDPNVKKFAVQKPSAYNKKNLYLSVPPRESISIESQPPAFPGEVGSVYSEVQVNKLELICGSPSMVTYHMWASCEHNGRQKGLKTLPSRNFVGEW